MEDQFLKALYAEKNRLTVRLEAIKSTISLFESIPDGDSKQDWKNVDTTPLSIPDSYKQARTWPKKVVFVLRALHKAATTIEIAKYMKPLEASKTVSQLRQIAGATLSGVLKNKVGRAANPGSKGYTYFLLSEEEYRLPEPNNSSKNQTHE